MCIRDRPIKAANSTEVIGVMLVSVSMDSVLHDRDAVGRNDAFIHILLHLWVGFKVAVYQLFGFLARNAHAFGSFSY